MGLKHRWERNVTFLKQSKQIFKRSLEYSLIILDSENKQQNDAKQRNNLETSKRCANIKLLGYMISQELSRKTEK